jgi:hypothetical protein
MIDYRCLLSSCAALDGASSLKILKLVLKAAARLFFFYATNPFASLKDDVDLLLLSSHNRKDLLEDLDVWCAQTEKSIHRVHIKANERFGIYFPGLWQWFLAKEMVSQAKGYLEFELGTLGRLFLSLRALEAHKYFEQLHRNDIRKTALVFSHMEMQLYENIVVQVAKLKRCKTYAMQHGFYSDDGAKISASAVNPVNYLANVADTFLAWGSETIREVSPYIDCEFVIVGKPASVVKEHGEITSLDRHGVLVLLDSKINQAMNQALLEKVLKEFGPDQVVNVITHPDDDTHYEGDFCIVCHDEVVPARVIGLNSSALIQYGIQGYRVLIHTGSRLLKAANSPVSGTTPSNELVLITDIPKAYWRQFIHCSGSQSVHKLDSQVT